MNSGPIDVRNVETFCGLTLDEVFAKAKEEGFGGGGGSVVPELPDKDSLTLGNIISWAGEQWIVSHVTGTEAYLTLKGLSSDFTWNDLQSACTTFARKFTEEQKTYLKSVTAGNTSGKVFVATKDQMNGGFSYFNSNSRRDVGDFYWTSTKNSSYGAWGVYSDGSLGNFSDIESQSFGFRPSVCIDLTLYNT